MKWFIQRTRCIASLQTLTLILLCSWNVYAQEAGETTSWCVSAWYPSSEHPGGYDTLMTNLDVIDHVNPFWYSPLPDGLIQIHDGAEDPEKLAEWREVGLSVVPSIFSSLWSMIETPEARHNHITQIVALVERMDYDGIDIDYEGFAISTREPFSLFIEELASALHANGRILSIAVHAKTDDGGSWEGAAAQDWVRIAAAVDVFNIMTYDYSSRNAPPGPIGPPQWIIDVLAYAETVTDLSKVRMGLHLYGYTWTRGRAPAVTTNWEAVQRWVENFGAEVQRDSEEAYIDFKPRGLPRQVVYFADAAGVRYKLQQITARFPTLGGLAIWGLGGEDPEAWDVLRELRPAECNRNTL